MKTYKVVFISRDELCVQQTSYIRACSQVDAINEVLFRHDVKCFLLVSVYDCLEESRYENEMTKEDRNLENFYASGL